MGRLSRLRALFFFALAWAIAWIPIAIGLGALESWYYGWAFPIGRLSRDLPVVMGVGAFCGFAFGLFLAAAERRRDFQSLSLSRFVLWGAAGAAVIPVIATIMDPPQSLMGTLWNVGPFAIPGGICAATSLALARRASHRLEGPAQIAALKK